MNKLTYFILFFVCSIGFCFSQEKVEGKNVEKNINWRTKVGYSNLLIDALNTTDNMYSDYEAMVQDVWDNGTNTDLAGEAKAIQSRLNDLSAKIDQTPVYTAGKDFQLAILNYIDAMKIKITALEKYGILVADENTDTETVNDASDAFNDATDNATVKRNTVRNQYRLYARTFTDKDK